MSTPPGTVLILGADGFIGRHLAFGLRAAGWKVIACARRTARLERMGFDVLEADLTDPYWHSLEHWQAPLKHVARVINAAGVLNAPDPVAQAVHVEAPEAIYRALPAGASGLLISAVGIDDAQTGFARFRRWGEDIAKARGITILRAGLVLGETSYGGSSLARALAAMPLVTPVVGKGAQPFNPIHAADLACAVDHMLRTPPGPGVHEIGGTETVTQAEMLRGVRRWLGLGKVPLLRLPVRLARALGRVGDALDMGPISATAVDQLQSGVLARPGAAVAALPEPPRGFSQLLAARPAGTQDLWHARLYLMRPLTRLMLGLLWLVSGLLGLLLSPDSFLPLIPDTAPIPDSVLTNMARFGGIVDLAIAAALFRGWRPRLMAAIQGLVVTGYTIAFTWLAPGLWLLPLGGLLKNPALLVLIILHGILEEER